MATRYHLTDQLWLSFKNKELHLMKSDKTDSRNTWQFPIDVNRVPNLINWLAQLDGKARKDEMAETLNLAVDVFGVNIVQQWLDQKKEGITK